MARRQAVAAETEIEPAQVPIYRVRPVAHTPELHIADYALAATPTKPLDFNTLSHLCLASGPYDVDEMGAVSNFVRHMLMDDRSIGAARTLEKTFLDIVRAAAEQEEEEKEDEEEEEEGNKERWAALERDKRADDYGWQMLLKANAVPFLDSSSYYQTVSVSTAPPAVKRPQSHERIHIPKLPNVINQRADKWYKSMVGEQRHEAFVTFGRLIKARTDLPNLTTHRYNAVLLSTNPPSTHAKRAYDREVIHLNNPPGPSVEHEYLVDAATRKQVQALEELSTHLDPDELSELTVELTAAQVREAELQRRETSVLANLARDKDVPKKGLESYKRQLKVNTDIRASDVRQMKRIVEMDKEASDHIESERKKVTAEEAKRKKAAIEQAQQPETKESLTQKGLSFYYRLRGFEQNDERSSLVVQLRRREGASGETKLFGFVALMPAARALLMIGNGIAGYRQSSINPASGVSTAIDVEPSQLARIASEQTHVAVINAFDGEDNKPLSVSLDSIFQANDRRKEEIQTVWANNVRHMEMLKPEVMEQAWVALTCYTIEPKINRVLLGNYYRLLAARFVVELLQEANKLKQHSNARVYFFPEAVHLTQPITEHAAKHWFKYTLIEEPNPKSPLKRKWLPDGVKNDAKLKDTVFHPRHMGAGVPNSIAMEDIPGNINVFKTASTTAQELRININTGIPIVGDLGKLTNLEGTLDDALNAFFVSEPKV